MYPRFVRVWINLYFLLMIPRQSLILFCNFTIFNAIVIVVRINMMLQVRIWRHNSLPQLFQLILIPKRGKSRNYILARTFTQHAHWNFVFYNFQCIAAKCLD